MGGMLSDRVISGPDTMGMLSPLGPNQGYGSIGRFTPRAPGNMIGSAIPSAQDYQLSEARRRLASQVGTGFAPFPTIALPVLGGGNPVLPQPSPVQPQFRPHPGAKGSAYQPQPGDTYGWWR